MKAIQIIHPITGQPCFTRHPEKLMQRYAAHIKHEVNLEIKRMREAAGMIFWNGSLDDECAMRKPGEVRS